MSRDFFPGRPDTNPEIKTLSAKSSCTHNMYKKTLFSIHVIADKYIKGLFSIYDEVAYAL
jgi:HEPN domain-containing protein